MHRDHEIHLRRRGRNFGLLLVLLAFIGVIFGLTVVKVRTGGLSEAFDHVARPAIIPGQTDSSQTATPTTPAEATQ